MINRKVKICFFAFVDLFLTFISQVIRRIQPVVTVLGSERGPEVNVIWVSIVLNLHTSVAPPTGQTHSHLVPQMLTLFSSSLVPGWGPFWCLARSPVCRVVLNSVGSNMRVVNMKILQISSLNWDSEPRNLSISNIEGLMPSVTWPPPTTHTHSLTTDKQKIRWPPSYL